MLVLTRKTDERINIGPDIQVVVLAVQSSRVRLGLVAPAEMPILRGELQLEAEWPTPEDASGIAAPPAASMTATMKTAARQAPRGVRLIGTIAPPSRRAAGCFRRDRPSEPW
jgi:carbon storage regulator